MTSPAAGALRRYDARIAAHTRAGLALGLLDLAFAGAFAWGLGGVLADLTRHGAVPLEDAYLWVALAAASARTGVRVAAGAVGTAGARAAKGLAFDDAVRRFRDHGRNGCGDGRETAAQRLVDGPAALDRYAAGWRVTRRLCLLAPVLVALMIAPVVWPAALAVAICALGAPILAALAGAAAKEASEKRLRRFDHLSSIFEDRVRKSATIAAFDAVAAQAARIRRNAEALAKETLAVLRVAFLASAAVDFFAAAAIALCAVYVGLELLDLSPLALTPDLNLAEGFFTLILVPEAFAPLRRLAADFHAKSDAAAAAESLAGEDEDAPRRTPPARPRAEGDVSFEAAAADFGAGARSAVFDFTAPAGALTVLHGPSGAGKTTALRLLLGLTPLAQGRIAIGGAPLAPDALHGRVGWADQTPILFEGRVFDNLRLADSDLSRARAQAALDGVGLLEELAGRGGLDAPVGEEGRGLSGGQIRRLAVARAFCPDVGLVLLDEPTADLDADAESLIIEALKARSAGLTVLATSHSPALIAAADRRVAVAGAAAP